MRLGLGSYTFTWAIGVPGHPPARPLSALDLVHECRRLGVGVLQIADNLPLIRSSDAELSALEKAAQAAGVAIELGTRGCTDDNLRGHLHLACRFKSPIVRIVLDRDDDQPPPVEIVRRIRSVLPDYIRAGIRIAIENHDRFTVRTLIDMVTQLGPDHVGICLDTVNSFGALEGPDVVVPALAPFALSVHLKDFVVSRPAHAMGFRIEGCPAGTGRLNVPWILDLLRDAGRDPHGILETWVSPLATLEDTIARERTWTEQGVAFLRTWIPN